MDHKFYSSHVLLILKDYPTPKLYSTTFYVKRVD